MLGRFFMVKERNTSLTQEIRGGAVTFLTVGLRPAAEGRRGAGVGTGSASPLSSHFSSLHASFSPPLRSLSSWQVAYILAVNSNIVTQTGGARRARGRLQG